MDTFDQESTSLREQIRELNQQIYSLRAQLDTLRATINEDSEDNCFYKTGKESNLYIAEKEDLLFGILTQVHDRYPKNSRAYAIIRSLLEVNPKRGECEYIISELRRIFSGRGKLTGTAKAQLKSLGFSFQEDSTHYKLTFHDPRYMFSVSKTPSDYRGGKTCFQIYVIL